MVVVHSAVVEGVVVVDVGTIAVVLVVLVGVLGLGLELCVIDEIVLAQHRVVRMMEVHVLSLQILIVLIGSVRCWLFVLGQKCIEINEVVLYRMILCCASCLCEVSELVFIMLHWSHSLLDHRCWLRRNHIEIEFKQADLNLRLYNCGRGFFTDYNRLSLLWFGLAGLGRLCF